MESWEQNEHCLKLILYAIIIVVFLVGAITYLLSLMLFAVLLALLVVAWLYELAQFIMGSRPE